MTAIDQTLVAQLNDLRRRVDELEQREVLVPAARSVAQSRAISTLAGIPGLRGFWPGNQFNVTPTVLDVSANSRHLTHGASTEVYNQWTAAGIYSSELLLDGSTQYFYRTDEGGLRITGTESYVVANDRGLTMGAWVRFANTASAIEAIMGKRVVATGQHSYYLRREADGTIDAEVSSDGTAVVGVNTVGTLAANTFAFVCMRFDPSTELAVWLDDEKVVNITSIPASIFNSTSPLVIGATGLGGGEFMDGRVALLWLSAMQLQDHWITHIYETTRAVVEGVV